MAKNIPSWLYFVGLAGLILIVMGKLILLYQYCRKRKNKISLQNNEDNMSKEEEAGNTDRNIDRRLSVIVPEDGVPEDINERKLSDDNSSVKSNEKAFDANYFTSQIDGTQKVYWIEEDDTEFKVEVRAQKEN